MRDVEKLDWAIRTQHLLTLGPPTFAYARWHADWQGECSCKAYWTGEPDDVVGRWHEHVWYQDFHEHRNRYPDDDVAALTLLWDRINGTGAAVRRALEGKR